MGWVKRTHCPACDGTIFVGNTHKAKCVGCGMTGNPETYPEKKHVKERNKTFLEGNILKKTR